MNEDVPSVKVFSFSVIRIMIYPPPRPAIAGLSSGLPVTLHSWKKSYLGLFLFLWVPPQRSIFPHAKKKKKRRLSRSNLTISLAQQTLFGEMTNVSVATRHSSKFKLATALLIQQL